MFSKDELLKSSSYVDGVWLQGEKKFAVDNPSGGETIIEVAEVEAEQVLGAIGAAENALELWSARTAKDRAEILMRWYELIVEHADILAEILTLEQGKPVSEAKEEILYGASFIQWFAEEGKRAYGDIIPSPVEGARIFVRKEPVGVCAFITPWNFPSAMITRKLGAALAAGCTAVCKPAALTPLSALALMVLAEEAGVPKGVINMVVGTHSKEIGQAFTESEIVKKISFTGSTAVGKALYAQSASTVKKISLELGGNAPFIVFDDADIEAAVEGAIACKFRNAGQTCVCANRIYVQDALYDSFAEKLAYKVEQMSVADGFEEGADIGPLINEGGLEKVQDHIRDALEHGASIMCGGSAHALGGLFFEPTVLKNVSPDAKVAREETFGPVAPLFKFKDEDDVIAQANDTEFGLASYFYAKDMSRIWKVAERLQYGMVGVNTPIISNEVAPFGGVKESGIGREGSKYGLEEFMELKYILMQG